MHQTIGTAQLASTCLRVKCPPKKLRHSRKIQDRHPCNLLLIFLFSIMLLFQDGTLPVINGVITPISTVLTPPIYRAIYRVHNPFGCNHSNGQTLGITRLGHKLFFSQGLKNLCGNSACGWPGWNMLEERFE